MMATVYVYKYALTEGIYEHKGKLEQTNRGKGVWTGLNFLIVGRDCALTIDEAEAEARKRAERKLASLEKQKEKLCQLAITPRWSSKVKR